MCLTSERNSDMFILNATKPTLVHSIKFIENYVKQFLLTASLAVNSVSGSRKQLMK